MKLPIFPFTSQLQMDLNIMPLILCLNLSLLQLLKYLLYQLTCERKLSQCLKFVSIYQKATVYLQLTTNLIRCQTLLFMLRWLQFKHLKTQIIKLHLYKLHPSKRLLGWFPPCKCLIYQLSSPWIKNIYRKTWNAAK